MKLEEKVAKLLIVKEKTISTAESCTGGLLADRLTNIPGSSDFFKLGLITYSNEAKHTLLGIPNKILKTPGAVSEPTAELMAKKVRLLAKTDFGIAISGIAGPAGGTSKKPVGLAFIAVNTPIEAICLKCLFRGSRHQIKSQAATQALELLAEFLL